MLVLVRAEERRGDPTVTALFVCIVGSLILKFFLIITGPVTNKYLNLMGLRKRVNTKLLMGDIALVGSYGIRRARSSSERGLELNCGMCSLFAIFCDCGSGFVV